MSGDEDVAAAYQYIGDVPNEWLAVAQGMYLLAHTLVLHKGLIFITSDPSDPHSLSTHVRGKAYSRHESTEM
jgi:hypothetical protein